MKKVLFLASWYPGRIDPYDGDFIERHAKAISLYNQVFVVYVAKDAGIKDGKIDIQKHVSGNLVTYKGYYPFSKTKTGWKEKLHSNRWTFKLYQRIYQSISNDYGRPDIVHLNVLMKAGIFALWLKKKYKLPYVLSEHWTGYERERHEGYFQKSFLYKFFSKMAYKNCDRGLPVTKNLGEKMNQLLGKIPLTVIPNVVDTSLFFPAFEHTNTKTRFVHISTLGYHKNIYGILEATEKLYQGRKDFELYLVGPASNELIQWTKDHGLYSNCIFFTGPVSYSDVANQLRNADALIMFSRYENLPCVILEALACGLPVISTNVGGISEVITTENGILIPSENKNELLGAINRILDKTDLFDKKKIAFSAGNNFSFKVIGRKFNECYDDLLSERH